jgi:hypothetical protein
MAYHFKVKKFICLIILGCIIVFIIYIIYFEFIYTTNVVTYFNINPKDITSIKITKYNYEKGNEFSKLAITNKADIIEFMTDLGNHTIKRKIYREFKYNHGMTIYTNDSTYEDYMILVKLPSIIYKIDISGGKSIYIKKYVRHEYYEYELFEFIGKPYVMDGYCEELEPH